MPDKIAEKPKKARTVSKAEYAVEQLSPDGQWAPPEPPDDDIAVAPIEDTTDGIKWIKEYGKDGKTYRVVRVCFGPKKLSFETVKKPTFG